jgi:hypothetical protein
MPVERCKNNRHYYNTSEHSSCPYCGVEQVELGAAVGHGRGDIGGRGDAPTLAKSAPPISGADPGLTIGRIERSIGIDPVVGWLVCTEGRDRGMDYRIRSENNWIGRSEQMRICIDGDEGIARDNHAVIGYDPQDNTYIIAPGTSNRMVYHNGKAIFAAEPLKRFDRIRLGQTELVFVPFLGEWDFRWV